MRLNGEQRIAASRQAVWDALNDPAILARCIPGCRSLEREADGRLRGIVEVRIGPIGARFQGLVTLSDIDAPASYTITGEGQGGVVGHARGSARVRLVEEGDGTLLSHVVEADVGGRLAQLGGPIIDATARQLADTFFRKFGELVGKPENASGGPAAAAIAPASRNSPPAGMPAGALPPPSRSPGYPLAWILAVTVAALAAFLAGRSAGGSGSDWAGLAIGLALLIVGAAGFEHGRRAAPTIVVDPEALARLLTRRA